jgi:hypothetical protein
MCLYSRCEREREDDSFFVFVFFFLKLRIVVRRSLLIFFSLPFAPSLTSRTRSHSFRQEKKKQRASLSSPPGPSTMFRKSDSSGDLAPAVERLHALADRLEVREDGGGEEKKKKKKSNRSISLRKPSTDSPSTSFSLLLTRLRCTYPFSKP